ncbi:aromatic motif membrane protein [Mycoplasma seminis]|uniref:Lipoprotein n=1 Tax=Mycoplasma seminis TaxID=512749 RepID=A0ABY9HBE3_9MOLU|nr:aromatic motif membrane protein [Mycoplasma seminis]WLP85922.1 hypothetical protein Q8852_02135 [Mycoplasma seminis]
MKTRFKFLFALGSLGFVLPAVSCADYSKQYQLTQYIDHEKDIVESVVSKEEKTHKNIMSTLLSLVYKNTTKAQNAKDLYLHQQNNISKEFWDKLNLIQKQYQEKYSSIDTSDLKNQIERKKEFLVFYRGDEEKYNQTLKEIEDLENQIAEAEKKKPSQPPAEYLSEFKNFISENWYFILNNLDKFDWKFISWAFNPYSPTSKAQIVSDEFIQKAQNTMPYPTLNFKDSFLTDIKKGDESAEIGDNEVYYLKKDKLVFRIMIHDISHDISSVSLSFVGLYFGGSKAKDISLNLVSQTIHTGFIHQYESGIKQYEQDMVVKQQYGYPAFVFPFAKEHHE